MEDKTEFKTEGETENETENERKRATLILFQNKCFNIQKQHLGFAAHYFESG